MNKRLFAAGLVLCIAACAPIQNEGYQQNRSFQSNPPFGTSAAGPSLRSTVEVDSDQFEKDVRFLGLEESFAPALLDVAPNSFFIRSWMNKQTGKTTHQLYVQNYYDGDWIFWNTAHDENADALNFVSIKRDVISCSHGCSYVEIFGADLDDGVLRAKAAKGADYRVKFSARTGRTLIIDISDSQIRSQLAAIDRARPPEPAKPSAQKKPPSHTRSPVRSKQ